MNDRQILATEGRALRERLGLPSDLHDELAPGFSGLFDELVFGAIWKRPGLDLPARMVATLAVLAALERPSIFAPYAQAAIGLGLTPAAIREIVLQACLYIGFPAAEETLKAAELGPCPSAPVDGRDIAALDTAGHDMMVSLHGERAGAGYASPDAGAPAALYELATRYGYGALWHRPGLARRERFITAVSVFAALEQSVQLNKFAASAMHNGLGFEQCVEVLIQIAPYSGFPRSLNALASLETLRDQG